MFTSFDKAIAAAVMGLLAILEVTIGPLPWLNEQWALSLIAAITPIIVFLVPNRET